MRTSLKLPSFRRPSCALALSLCSIAAADEAPDADRTFLDASKTSPSSTSPPESRRRTVSARGQPGPYIRHSQGCRNVRVLLGEDRANALTVSGFWSYASRIEGNAPVE